jgi:hypothetical protein
VTTRPTVHQYAVSNDDDYYPDFEEPTTAQRDRATEEEFRKTCEKGTPEYGLLVLAIGEWAARMNYPDNPPEWAIDACRKLYQRSQIIPHPIVQKTLGPCASESDGRLLERVADFIQDIDLHPVTLKLGQSVSVRSAIRRALAVARQPENEANIRRLQRLWAKDEDHRLERATIRFMKKRGIPIDVWCHKGEARPDAGRGAGEDCEEPGAGVL